MCRSPRSPRSCRGGAALLVIATALFAVSAAGCERSGSPPTAELTSHDLPQWISRIYPAPGAEASLGEAVQVEHSLTPTETEGFRLMIDGVDVTAYALTTPGLVSYDADDVDDGPVPAALDPGHHRARIEHVQLDEFGEPHDVLDAFEWTFDVFGAAPETP